MTRDEATDIHGEHDDPKKPTLRLSYKEEDAEH